MAPAKPSLNQAPLSMRPGDSGFGMELDRLMAEVGPLTEGDALRADDRRRIARAVSGRAVEDKRGLTAVKGDERLRQQRRPRRLPGGSGGRRVNETRAVADDAREKVEPMDAEIPKNEIVDGFERRPGDPAVVPADLDMNAGDFADEAGADRFPDVGEMRRPAAVLIDRELEVAPRRQLDEFAPVVEVLDERLLRQDVLSRVQRAPHEVEAHVRRGR